MQAESPTHFSSIVDLNPIEGSFDLAGRKFKYGSKLSLKVDIILHPAPKEAPNPLRVTAYQEKPFESGSSNRIDWAKVSKKVSEFVVQVTIIIIGTIAIQARIASLKGTTTSPLLFMHRIDLNDPRYRAQNSGMI